MRDFVQTQTNDVFLRVHVLPAYHIGFISLCIGTFVLSLLLTMQRTLDGSYLFAVIGILVVFEFISMMVLLIRRNQPFFALLILFLFLSPVHVFIVNYMMNSQLSNWRARLFYRQEMLETLGLMFIYAAFFFSVISIFLLFLQPSRTGCPPRELSKRGQWAVVAVGLGSAVTAILAYASTTREMWILDASIGDRFIQQFAALGLGVASFLGLLFRARLVRATSLAAIIAAVIVAASGFRYVLVYCGLAIISTVLSRKYIRVPTLVVLLICFSLFYVLMLVFAYFRQNGIDAVSMFSGASWVNVRMTDIFAYSGAHEQTFLYTVNYAVHLNERMFGLTYLYGILRVLPNFVHSALFYTERPQDILANSAPYFFIESNLNLGAYFFAEAILNFGVIGPFPLLIVVAFLGAWLERMKSQGEFWQSIYAVSSMLIPALALYGWGNFIKQFACCALLCAIIMRNRVKWQKNIGSTYLKDPIV